MKKITTSSAVNFATGMGTIENEILTAEIPSFTTSFDSLEVNFRYLQGDKILKAGSRTFLSREVINEMFNEVKTYMTFSFDDNFCEALEEAFYLVFKFEMYQTLLPLNENLTINDLIISTNE